jgi:hypothetical protein
MSSSAIQPIAPLSLESTLRATLKDALAPIENAASSATGSTATPPATQPDSSQLSPLAKLVGALDNLQKTDPSKYTHLTQQIATKLQTAAQAAQTQGNSSEAKQLSALASDFSSASKTGQTSALIENLTSATATGGHRYEGSNGSSSAGASNSSQLLSLVQQSENPSKRSTASNAASIIFNTLNGAGVTV